MKTNKLLEASAITKHFVTDREKQIKKALCQLLIDKGHRKYAERFWKFDFNIIDSKKHPDFTAAISFDEATVFISDGFLTGQGIFNQLDVLLRHELAHNLMMHQIRMMYVFKKLHASNPDEAYEHISNSVSLHEILNWLEDFEISNKRYTTEDKKIVRNMQLNGQVIGGLITEDHRSSWANLPLETMYEQLTNELITITSEIKNNPYWTPTDGLKVQEAKLIKMYNDVTKPSGIKAPIDIFIKSKTFANYAPVYKKLVIDLYEGFKDLDLALDINKTEILAIIEGIASTAPQEVFDIVHPTTGEVISTLYTPEEKMLANEVLKNLVGNNKYDPLKFNIKRRTNSQEYKDAWNTIINNLDKKQFDNETLEQLLDDINKTE